MCEPDVRIHAEVAPPRNDYHPELEPPRKEPPRPAEPPPDTESRSLNSPIRRTRTRIIKTPERYTDSTRNEIVDNLSHRTYRLCHALSYFR